MSSTVKLVLRQPPNVEFVQGYPGIASGPERPQAGVKGMIELRAGNQGIRAKWVRIELRKVETLPGGGQANTFYDFVGQGPINVWQTSDEYGMLYSNDFPFYIRIPEAIPPSLALEKNAGIRYELVAQVGIKAKKGLFRRDKSSVISTTAPIIIDKHELHSTWPLYQQPESRQVSQDGVFLTVERGSTCYGPGDRVSVMATLKSDNINTVILRGFEFNLKESTIFRAGANATGRKAAPQVRVTIIGEQKVPVNATLSGGAQHRAELACVIPSQHTTTTLSSARHIDITYTIHVKALLGTGTPVVMELPVVVSNWPRAVSIEAIRRIGPTPNLSLIGAHHDGSGARTSISIPPQLQQSASVSGHGPTQDLVSDNRLYNTMPTPGTSDFPVRAYSPPIDEFGRSNGGILGGGGGSSVGHGQSYGTSGGIGASATVPGRLNSPMDVSTQRPSFYEPPGMNLRPRPAAQTMGSPNTNRYTIANINEADDLPGSTESLLRRPSAQIGTTSPLASPAPRWQTAEEEKRRLYESAKARVDQVQGRPSTPSIQGHGNPTTQRPSTAGSTSPIRAHWPSAEEEKLRLYNQAQAKALQTQGLAALQNDGQSPPASPKPSDAALYAQAMSAVSRNNNLPTPGGSGSNPAAVGSSSMTAPQMRMPKPQYPTAEEEKAMLRRYNEAKAAVDRVQGPDGDSAPVAYDALYPGTGALAATSPFAATSAGQGSSSQPLSAYEEKEHLRRRYESESSAVRIPTAQPYEQQGYVSPPPVQAPQPYGNNNAYASPPPAVGSSSAYGNGLSEKELLRRKFEADDAAALSIGAPPLPPPRANGSSHEANRTPSYTARSQPLPPTGSAFQPLSAAEEKARLKAQYAAEDRAANGEAPPVLPAPRVAPTSPPVASQGLPNIPPPPPLAPRPPPDYIQRTQEEDRKSRFVADDASFAAAFQQQVNDADESGTFGPVSRPPLPPKVPIDL